jgi:hypothetical protein
MNMSVSGRLARVSSALNVFLFAVGGYEGVKYAHINARLLTSLLNIPELISVVIVTLLYSLQFISSMLLLVPIMQESRVPKAIVHGILSFASIVEFMISIVYSDFDGKLKSLFMCLSCIQQTLVGISSRHMRIHGTYERSSYIKMRIDDYTSFVKTRASRYKLSSITTVAIVIILIYSVPTWISCLYDTSFAGQLAKMRVMRHIAVIAFLAAVGSEDTRCKKNL